MRTTRTLAIAAALGLGMVSVASANVVYDSETTNAWFNANIKTSSALSSEWTCPKDGAADVKGESNAHYIALDTDLDDPLIYTAPRASEPVAIVAAEMTATVNASVPELKDVPQAALCVIGTGTATNWVGLVGIENDGTNWVTFSTPVPVAGETYSVRIEFDQRQGEPRRIRYRVGDTVLGDGWYLNPQNTAAANIRSVSFSGSGDISGLGGSNVVANAATFNGVGYLTFEAALAAAKAAGTGWNDANPIVLYENVNWTAETGIAYFNENGRILTISDGVFTKSGNTYTVTAQRDCEAKIDSTYYATFDEAVAVAGASDTIVVNTAITKSLTVAKSYGLNPGGKLKCTALTVDAGKTLTLAGALAVSGNATVNGAVAGETLTVNGTLTGVNVEKLTFGNGATFAYTGAKLAPTSLTQSGALTITGLADAEIGTEVITATGLDLSEITATVKEGTCLEIVGNTLTVVKEILATITASSEAEGYDYTNGTVSVTANVKDGKTATAVLTVVGFDGTTVKSVAARSVTSGAALTWDIAEAMEGALVPGGAYTYKVEVMVDNKVAAVKSGEFTAAKWGADGAWFKADASSGTSVVAGGAWDGTAPEIVNNKYAVSDSTFNVTSEAGSSRFTRVDTKVSFESLPDGDPDMVEGDTIGGFVATAEGWKALTLVNEEKAWVTLTGADTPAVNTEYAIRAELDFSDASTQRVRFFVATEGGDFIPLSYNGSQWLATTKVQQTLQKVEFQGEGALESVMATVEDKALAEVGGVEYVTMAAALVAAKDDPNKSVRLLTNVTMAPTAAGTYRFDRNGHAFNLELPEGWTSDWNESTGTLTVIDKQMPFVQELAASTICYGQALSASELTGVMTNKNGTVVEGTFAWVDGTIAPNVADGTTNRLFEVSFTPEDQTKYFCATVETTVAVSRAELAVKADDKTVVAGNPAPEYTCTITGFVLGETSDVVEGAASFSCDYTTSSPTGTYDIVVSVGTLAADNYTFASFTKGTLTVQQAEAKYGDTYYASVADALEAAKSADDANPKIEVLVVDPDKPAVIPDGAEVDYELNDEEVAAGSGTAVLPYTGSGTVKVTTTDASKQVTVSKNGQGHFVATVETKPALVMAIEVAGKALPSPDDNTDFKAWLDENIAAYKAANTGTDAISTELNAPVEANGISKLNNYLLFSKNVAEVTADDVVAIEKLAVDTLSDGIKIAVPTIENPKADAMGYRIVYRVMKGETKVQDFKSQENLKVPLSSGTGTYRVDAVIVPDDNN